MYYFLLMFLIKISIAKSNNLDFDTKIVRGFESKLDELAKYIVSIRYKSNSINYGGSHYCAGSILNEATILTAAQCVMNNRKVKIKASDIEVVAGSPWRITRKDFVQERFAKRIITHPDYDPIHKEADIALILLAKGLIEDGKRVQRVELIEEQPEKGWMCTTLGWGILYDDGPEDAAGPMPDKIQYVNVTISDEPSYLIVALGRDNFTKNDLGRGTCKGDSGGPLFCDGDKVAGIISFNLGFCGFKSLFTNLIYYRKWILEDYKKGKHGNQGAQLKFQIALVWIAVFKICNL